jgi:hypothetical protein
VYSNDRTQKIMGRKRGRRETGKEERNCSTEKKPNQFKDL